MAEGPDIQGIKNFLECAICFDIFDNPKQLKCFHHFCRECLEEIIQFKDDGSGVINCPLKCSIETFISSIETLNDLPVSYEFKGLMEYMKTNETELHPENLECCNNNCPNLISIYCCGGLMCDSCSTSHMKSGSNHFPVGLSFSKRQGKLMVVCEEHAKSRCTHLCEDGKFLCSYCMIRDEEHVAHLKTDVDHDVELLKEALTNDSNEKSRMLQYKKSTKENIPFIINRFDDLLDMREDVCLSQYKNYLKNEKEILMGKLRSAFDLHMQKYDQNISENYYKETLQKNDIVLALEKDLILGTIRNNRIKSTLECDTLSISDNFNFLDEHPLGDINVSFGEEVSIWDPPKPTLNDNIKRGSEKSNGTMVSELIDNVVQPTDARKLAIDRRNTEGNAFDGDSNAKYLSEKCDWVKYLSEKCDWVQETHSCDTNSIVPTGKQRTDISKITKNASCEVVQPYFDIEIDKVPAGRLIMTLYYNDAQKICENFVKLCTHYEGFGYKDSKIHRVSRLGGYCLGGDITYDDRIAVSIPCEDYNSRRDGKGILSMVSVNGFVRSKFLITSKAKPGKPRGKHVAIGKVTDGTLNVLEKVMAVKNTSMLKPRQEIVIVNSGVLNKGVV